MLYYYNVWKTKATPRAQAWFAALEAVLLFLKARFGFFGSAAGSFLALHLSKQVTCWRCALLAMCAGAPLALDSAGAGHIARKGLCVWPRQDFRQTQRVANDLFPGSPLAD